MRCANGRHACAGPSSARFSSTREATGSGPRRRTVSRRHLLRYGGTEPQSSHLIPTLVSAGSPLPPLPYRPSTLARLAARLVAQLGYSQVNVGGVSWGGGIAQQFAHQHGEMCLKLILAATSPGAIMVPGKLSVIQKLATPRRYGDRNHMRSSAAAISA